MLPCQARCRALVFAGAFAQCLAAQTGVAAALPKGAIPLITPKSQPTQQKPAGSYFSDKSGVPTFTNRVGHYRGQTAFTEIDLKFEPIVVPANYSARGKYARTDVESLARRYARNYRLSPNLVLAVIKAESNGDPNAVSPKGASGLMQLMPATAAQMGVTDIFDPAQNIAAGVQYLSKLLRMYHGDRDLALAAYNAGPGAVQKHQGVPPFQETREYIERIRGFLQGPQTKSVTIDFKSDTERPARSSRGYAYTVHFKSGLQQPANEVTEQGAKYIVVVRGDSYEVDKSTVVKIDTN